MLLASVFMYMVLAAQFESFSYPFIIMLTLPLSIPFALFSLWITGRALSLWSALGMFLLLGNCEEERNPAGRLHQPPRGRGMPVRDAILEANRVRLRPILMTTLSIIAGLIPVAIGIGAGSEQRASIAVTIIGGQTLCLLLTLLVVPVGYSYLAEFEALPWREWKNHLFTKPAVPISSSETTKHCARNEQPRVSSGLATPDSASFVVQCVRRIHFRRSSRRKIRCQHCRASQRKSQGQVGFKSVACT